MNLSVKVISRRPGTDSLVDAQELYRSHYLSGGSEFAQGTVDEYSKRAARILHQTERVEVYVFSSTTPVAFAAFYKYEDTHYGLTICPILKWIPREHNSRDVVVSLSKGIREALNHELFMNCNYVLHQRHTSHRKQSITFRRIHGCS